MTSLGWSPSSFQSDTASGTMAEGHLATIIPGAALRVAAGWLKKKPRNRFAVPRINKSSSSAPEGNPAAQHGGVFVSRLAKSFDAASF
jgi:hypothetical protein